jgi:hypothetical protein
VYQSLPPVSAELSGSKHNRLTSRRVPTTLCAERDRAAVARVTNVLAHRDIVERAGRARKQVKERYGAVSSVVL